EIQNPPVPSASLFKMTADLRVDAPLGTIPGAAPKVGVLTQNIGLGQVGATLTSGDPIPPITEALIAEYVHARWEAETIPHTVQQDNLSYGGRTFDAHFQTFDDENNAAKRISVVAMGTAVTIGIPCALQLSNITGGVPTPLAVVARLMLATQLDVQPGRVRANLASATVTIEDLAPGAGVGGANFTLAQAFVEPLITAQLALRATAVAQAVGMISVDVPTVTQIEAFIAQQLHAKVAAQPNIGLWTPDFTGSEVTVTDATPKVLASAVAIAINARAGSNINQIDNFIPAGDGFAVAMLGAKVLEIINTQINKSEDDGGLGGIPQTRTIEGKQVEIHRLDFSLRTGAIRGEGDVTVIDAVAGSIDIDAGFWADIGLSWQDESDGTQTIQPTVIDDDVSLSAGAWIVMVILGFILGGLIIGVILLVVYLVVEGIAESIGGSIIQNETTGQVRTLGAWPSTLDGIGQITSRFENPVIIEPGAIVFSGSITVTSTNALTASAPPDAQGPYFATARQPLAVSGGPPIAAAAYYWHFGDGASLPGISALHEYTHSGTYVSRLDSAVGQPGGVALGNLTLVRVRNVPAVISISAPTSVKEGQNFDVVVDFTDAEWLDVHEVIVDFGDDTKPALPAVAETNTEPEAVGRAVATHAYCDGGSYEIRVQVIDSDGGIATAMCDIDVTNVPPVVTAPERMYAYICSPLTLIAQFTDAGWCDTHTGSWDFGDCSAVIDATIRELHEPPEGVGYAAATHTYHDCGRFEARVVVTDDDGGVGTDTTIVEVVDVRNRTFEHGFRELPVGEVANEWEPVGNGEFAAEHSVLRGGRAAQRMRGRGAPVGIRQSIGANAGWEYQITAHCHAPGTGTEMAVGIDPNGGADPSQGDVVWMRAAAVELWRPTTVRATATGSTITVFVMLDHAGGPDNPKGTSDGVAVGYVDEVALIAVPCPLPKIRRPKVPPVDTRKCIDWKGEKAPQRLDDETVRGGVRFRTAGPLQLTQVGVGVVGLMLPPRGMVVDFAEPVGEVTLTIMVQGSADIRVSAVDEQGQVVAGATSTDTDGPNRMITFDAVGARQLSVVTRPGAEAFLVEVCWKPTTARPDDRPPVTGPRNHIPTTSIPATSKPTNRK
ncbi:MAG TPA: PKD domain-containing protein, partial [Ilumatobacteraceae bacterium]|nr:PKD domain-containing protein [Ilumatobacteraceae bacterium]